MGSTRTLQVVSCYAEGEVGDVVVGGVEPPPGDSLWEQSRFLARDRKLRDHLLNEPRGGLCRHVNLLVRTRLERSGTSEDARPGALPGRVAGARVRAGVADSFRVRVPRTPRPSATLIDTQTNELIKLEAETPGHA